MEKQPQPVSARKTTGPKPQRLKINMDWQTAVAKALKKPRESKKS
jgi:hypothetical protein